jgi:uncharacterized protein (TIGR02266 family)
MDGSDNKSGTGEDRRREEREPVTLVVDYEGVEDLVGDYTENLSTGGTFVHTERTFELGTEVRLILSFPGLVKPISLDGVVRWTRAGGEEERGVGIEFTSLGEGSERLQQIIEAISNRDPDYVKRLFKVLVVEDNPHVARLIRDGLGGSSQLGEDLAFSCRICSNGRDALDALHSEHFDAVIIDIYLPILDGSTVIAELRAEESLRSLPVIAVSAGGQPARQAAMKAGADFFLDKPMRLRQILESMKKLMSLER